MSDRLRVGIIGANARSGWARESHVPAVRHLDGLTLAAVATSDAATAEEAAAAFGADRAYGDGLALAADPAVDLVAVTTRVPQHRDIVLAALAAGKHVYCEWPLGVGAPESDELAARAAAAGVHHAIGLQLRCSPAVRRAAALLRAGAIGRVLSVAAASSTAGFGPAVADPFLYLEDPATFANMVTIQGAHTIDLVAALLGTPVGLSALGSRQFPEIRVGGRGERRARVTFDHLLVQGLLPGAVPFAVEVAGGRESATPFRLDIVGTDGTLTLDGGAARGLQSGRIGLLRDGARVAVDEGELAPLADEAVNVAGVYAGLRDDIRGGTRRVAGFTHALGLTRLIEDVLAAAADRRWVDARGWPA